jgi:AraC family transcriptional regulator of adaptative response / DNA-3-methyladenine glycosylase II
VLGADPVLSPLVEKAPGRRVPGAVDGAEMAVRAVLGQQESVTGARTLAGRLAARFGEALPHPDGGVVRLFPTADALAGASDADLPMPAARRRAVRALTTALADGTLVLDPGADRAAVAAGLLALSGIGPWTASYVAMRALGDPDAFPAADLGVLRSLERLGLPATPLAAAERAEQWRPWRAYAVQHLWSA